MLSLFDLWLPILASGAAVFVVSSIVHMCLPIHKGDYGKLPGEDAILGSMRDHGVNPGQYMFPGCTSMKEMGTPEMGEKYKRGPVGYLSVLPTGTPNMGKSLLLWFLLTILVGIFVAYLASQALRAGEDYMKVFRFCGSAAILGHAVGSIHDSIWKGVRWSITLKFVFDGVLYGLVTAGVFAWLWPAA